MKNVLLICCLASLSFGVYANDLTQLNFLGFSKTGKYLAFQQYGIHEGQGTAFAESFFIDVKENDYAAKPIETTGAPKDDLAKIRANNLNEAKAKLAELEIAGDLQGTQVIARSIHDLDIKAHSARFDLGSAVAGAIVKAYSLKLEEKTGTQECMAGAKSKLFTLELLNEQDKKTFVLQKDKKLPPSRGCPTGYKIEDVYVFEDKAIVVFLNVLHQGFEGQTLRYMAVSGELK
jgi:predicted secreted protein